MKMRPYTAVFAAFIQLLLTQKSQAALRSYNLTLHNDTRAPGKLALLTWRRHTANISCTDGFSREVFLINGQTPGPLIEVDEGDELEVFVKNNLAVEMAIHWHGRYSLGYVE